MRCGVTTGARGSAGRVEASCVFGHHKISRIHGFRPAPAGLLLVPKAPNPAIRASSPSARASPMAANTRSTASLATALLRPVRATSRSAISALFTRSPHPPSCPAPRLPIGQGAGQRSPPKRTVHRGRFRIPYRPSHRPAIRPASTSVGVRTRCAPEWPPPSSGPPAPPRFIGHSTWMSRTGSRPKRLGMRVFTSSTIRETAVSGSSAATK